jgi:hypothetical protein
MHRAARAGDEEQHGNEVERVEAGHHDSPRAAASAGLRGSESLIGISFVAGGW